MPKPLYKGMEPPNIRATQERGEREHAEGDSPSKADENPERIIEEETSEENEEKL